MSDQKMPHQAVYRSAYLTRLAIGAVAAVAITFALGVLVMWMNGFIVEDEPSTAALTPCIFGEQESKAPDDPFAKQTVAFDCISPEEEKPLFVQWFDQILSRRSDDAATSGASGG